MHVVDELADPLCKAFALCFESQLQRLGIGRGEICRAHRVDHLAGKKSNPFLGARLDFERLDAVDEVTRVEEIALAKVVEPRIALPLPGGEAPVAPVGQRNRRAFLSGFARQHRLPQRCVLPGVVRLQPREPDGVDPHRLQRAAEFGIGRHAQGAEEMLQERLSGVGMLTGRGWTCGCHAGVDEDPVLANSAIIALHNAQVKEV